MPPPDANAMNPPNGVEIEQLAARLLGRHQELLAQLRQRLRQTGRRLETALLDAPCILGQMQHCDASQLAQELAELRDIEDAIARLAAASYGRCVICGAAIALARLQVQLSAQRCLPCQKEFEQRPHAI